jgi:hypothetical protein
MSRVKAINNVFKVSPTKDEDGKNDGLKPMQTRRPTLNGGRKMFVGGKLIPIKLSHYTTKITFSYMSLNIHHAQKYFKVHLYKPILIIFTLYFTFPCRTTVFKVITTKMKRDYVNKAICYMDANHSEICSKCLLQTASTRFNLKPAACVGRTDRQIFRSTS